MQFNKQKLNKKPIVSRTLIFSANVVYFSYNHIQTVFILLHK